MEADVGMTKQQKICEPGREVNVGPKIKQSTYL